MPCREKLVKTSRRERRHPGSIVDSTSRRTHPRVHRIAIEPQIAGGAYASRSAERVAHVLDAAGGGRRSPCRCGVGTPRSSRRSERRRGSSVSSAVLTCSDVDRRAFKNGESRGDRSGRKFCTEGIGDDFSPAHRVGDRRLARKCARVAWLAPAHELAVLDGLDDLFASSCSTRCDGDDCLSCSRRSSRVPVLERPEVHGRFGASRQHSRDLFR